VLVSGLARSHTGFWKESDDTLVLSIQDTSLLVVQPHAAYMAVGEISDSCGQSSHDERAQVFRVFPQGNASVKF